MTHINILPEEIKFNILSHLSYKDLNSSVAINKSWMDTTLNYYRDNKRTECLTLVKLVTEIFSSNDDQSIDISFLKKDVNIIGSSLEEIQNNSQNIKKEIFEKTQNILEEPKFFSELINHLSDYLSRKERAKVMLTLSLISDPKKREEIMFDIVKSYIKCKELELAISYYKQLNFEDLEVKNFAFNFFIIACDERNLKIISELISINYQVHFILILKFNEMQLFELLKEATFIDENIAQLFNHTILQLINKNNEVDACKLWKHYLSLLMESKDLCATPEILEYLIKTNQKEKSLHFITLIEDNDLHDSICLNIYKSILKKNEILEALDLLLNEVRNEEIRNKMLNYRNDAM